MTTATFRVVDGWMNISQVSALLLVVDTTISRNLEPLGLQSEIEEVGGREKRLSPTAVLRLAQHFKMVPLSEVGGALVSHAEEHAAPERASEVEAEVQKFIDAVSDAAPTPALEAAHDRFLARAKKLVSADVYQQLEQAYRATHRAR